MSLKLKLKFIILFSNIRFCDRICSIYEMNKNHLENAISTLISLYIFFIICNFHLLVQLTVVYSSHSVCFYLYIKQKCKQSFWV